ncbi:DUF739 family protein [Clostridium kluyveri]|uniref:DUF739 family protein n=1 Tax=Clostridium kluyveri TaxID=1534 RepID=UPI002246CA6B|nr:DUF739 family protein [Clostridium kluyveri]UZQ49080.1 helix-turn-helix transcriptional regulator [Clostridium kluyveri]
MKTNKLKGKITETKKNYLDCAKALNISTTSFSNKINGKSSFKVEEAVKLSKYLNLSYDEKVDIFLS